MTTQLHYWKNTLHTLPDLLPHPTDHPRPPQRTLRGDRRGFGIGPELHRQLRSMARASNSTLFMTLHAAFAALLSRLTGTEDIVIGTPIAGRAEPALDDLVGMFVNTLVLRTRVTGAESFTELLDDTREVDLGAFIHADLPFEQLVEALAPVRSTAHSPLFQVSLEFDSSAPHDLEIPGLTVHPAETAPATAKVDLELVVTEKLDSTGEPMGIAAGFTYATDLFDPATITGFANRFLRILEQIVADPAIVVGDIRLGDEEVPTAGLPASTPHLWSELLAVAAQARREDVAVSCEGRHLTYRELDERSNRLARMLVQRGAGPEQAVASALPRSIASVLTLWAVVKTGAALVPVDPTYPPARISHMLDDCGARLGITVSEYRAKLPEALSWLVLDEPGFDEHLQGLPAAVVTDADRTTTLRLGHPAYLIYTSGSTGTPKGVVLTHRGLADLAEQERVRLGVTPEARVSHLASPSFDASIFEMTMAFCAGASVTIAPPMTYGGPALAEFFVREGVTHAFITPTALATLEPDGLDTVRVLTVAGESCPSALASRWAPGRRMVNAYGPTETTIMSHMSEPLTSGDPVTIGRPTRGFVAAVLDDRLHPVPAGTPGELYLAGPGLARGYNARPGTTAHHFVACPFTKFGDRMYRTGDLVRSRADGTLEHLGRTDFQIKIRGFRIEPGEIDTALTTHPDVSFAATISRPGPGGVPAIVTYIRSDTRSADPAELTAYLSQLLPAHMIPAAIVHLDHIPLTPAGKLDRSALPEPAFHSESTPLRGPRTATERAVLHAFQEALRPEGGDDDAGRIGVDEDFFALGGTSLTAIGVVTAVEERLGRAVPLQALFLDPTAAGLARRLDAESDSARSDAGAIDAALRVLVPLHPGGSRPPLFCVHAGIGLAWAYTSLVRHLSPDRPVYGLQLPALSGGPNYESIEELARRYVDEVKAIQPNGPYHLLGWSLGGTIAHAMATALRCDGDEVAALVLLDSYPGNPEGDHAATLPIRELLAGLGVDAGAEAGDEDLTYGEAALRIQRAYGSAVAGLTAEHLRRINEGYANSTRMLGRFTPASFDGDLLFFTAAEAAQDGGGAHAVEAWRTSVAGTIHEHSVACRHNDMTQPEPAQEIGPVVERYLSAGG
ncbi:non-ribosomal peptide synthetase [Rhodococcus tibetensis]|uniref:Amino acid adenylation domain-containing protein n=1 Tax=Rhodococcus tibetensis TaxID=2965064 RepID=A0ABT1QL42_9NOCA|nr:non-ribosomal peptide synthetase [Rhodococcus sp. FXJ9.536]MCQ4122383.1 amino acid adenylation domain-containing protein [Rhodococcus sp. FXJ9.536]